MDEGEQYCSPSSISAGYVLLAHQYLAGWEREAIANRDLWRLRRVLHQFNLVAIRIGDPCLCIEIQAHLGLDIDRYTPGANFLDEILDALNREANVHEALLRRAFRGRWAVREQLDEAITTHMQVNEHE